MDLGNIKKTVGGYEVKDLRWIERDGLIVGMVKCPLFGKPTLHDGFISGQWNKHGFPQRVNKGRDEMKLEYRIK
jgi:hypothetical protein